VSFFGTFFIATSKDLSDFGALVFVALLLILHFGGSISRYESFVFL
jgi:hypothetical protein